MSAHTKDTDMLVYLATNNLMHARIDCGNAELMEQLANAAGIPVQGEGWAWAYAVMNVLARSPHFVKLHLKLAQAPTGQTMRRAVYITKSEAYAMQKKKKAKEALRPACKVS